MLNNTSSSLLPYTTLFRSFCGRRGCSVCQLQCTFRGFLAGHDVQRIPIMAEQNKPPNGELIRSLRLSEVLSYRSEEHTSGLQSRGHLLCRLLLEKKKSTTI